MNNSTALCSFFYARALVFSRHAPDKYTGMFDGFLHMLRPDDAAKWFPPHVKLLLMSQSDFSLPNHAFRDYSVPRKYDFTYSGSDQDVRNDCVGWSSFAKNWSFVKEALEVMCGEFHLKGVLVATIDKQNVKRCSIPKSCDGLITQTQYISQAEFHSYVEQSRFLFLPQIHDASPRVSTQALALDVPLLMNAYISGGWKYLNEKTGEFFHDLSDFRDALRKIITNADIEKHYEPRKWVTECVFVFLIQCLIRCFAEWLPAGCCGPSFSSPLHPPFPAMMFSQTLRQREILQTAVRVDRH